MTMHTSIKITDISNDGAGVGRITAAENDCKTCNNGKAIFVPYTAIGDCIEAVEVKSKKSIVHAQLSRIITESPNRISVDCPYFTQCGGCDFRHISYEAELKAKSNFIQNAFTKIGKLKPEFLPIIPSETTNYYRNNVQFQVGRSQSGGLFYGFYAPKSKTIIPLSPESNCKLYHPEFAQIAEESLKQIQNSCRIPKQICIRKGHYSGETSAVADKTTLLIGKSKISDTMCGVKVNISPQSFYQVNTPAAEKLYGVIKEFATPKDKIILDLYCGIGTIGLSLADEACEIIGIECVESAVRNAITNAKINGIQNARFICGDAAADFPENIHPDVVILDPARRGCDFSVLEKVAKLSPAKIVMVSCDPATAARDCAVLATFGYRTLQVQGVDLFPRTRHVECAAVLES
ncbi:MAG: 23S rRNA (uracil(1939)-C(5))-methyltransferase RlmD [Oscillospiraceae bacterium]|nr:23S rRNA (uracil(1939)-C(5))-methyltransferase RlmD [Oscillospiraceae bacterium]